jgi:RHS repeat-associated protein
MLRMLQNMTTLAVLVVCCVGCGNDSSRAEDGGVSDPTATPGAGPVSVSTQPLPRGCASAVDLTGATGFYESVRCLFEGNDPVQKGVAPGTITPERVAVLQGRATDKSGAPLEGVVVTVLHGAQYGQTVTGAQGTYDLAVNGGGQVTLTFAKQGFIHVQRQREVEPRRFAPFPEVALLAREPVAGTVALDAMQGPQLVRGTEQKDDDGPRAHAVVFQPGTKAMAQMPSGEGIPLSNLSVRLTEFTVGERGVAAMPGDLPPTSAYTYALDLTVDEAEAMGAKQVRFDPPLVNYTDNFLKFPAGTSVPVGYYDEDKGAWEPSESGVVIAIVGISSGRAELDVTGDGRADGEDKLTPYGITADELALLAEKYQDGQSLWRTRTPHFSQIDLNWGTTLPADGVEPPADSETRGPEDCRSSASGSIIGCEDQTLGEVLPVAGTPYALHYQSERMQGRHDTREIEITLSGKSVPKSLRGIELEVTVLGQVTRQHFDPAPNLKHVFRWDGRDAYGRVWQGRQPAIIRVGYTYPGQYAETGWFSANPKVAISGSPSRQEITLWSHWEEHVGTVDATARGLGGFSLDVHHVYDPLGGVLHRGDGRQRSSERLGQRVVTLAGTGEKGPLNDGGDAKNASFTELAGVAMAPDGTIYLADDEGNRIRRIRPNGTIDTYAGTGKPGVSGDNGPATAAAVGHPYGLALAPDGTLYVGQRADKVIRAIGPNGTIRTVAGGGKPKDGVGDGPDALKAEFASPYSLALGNNGTLYIADLGEFDEDLRHVSRIRALAPDGSIRTAVGSGKLKVVQLSNGSLRTNGKQQEDEEGIQATDADLITPSNIVVAADGTLFIAETEMHRIRKVTPDGRISRVAGNGLDEDSGDGGLALDAGLRPFGMAVMRDGSLYVSDNGQRRIRRVRPDGKIESAAGTGLLPTREQALAGGPALTTPLINPTSLVADKHGRLLFVQAPGLLTRLEDALPEFQHGDSLVADDSGDVAFRFDALGKHVSTIDTLTGVERLRFTHDDRGLLTTITDSDGNRTTVERDASGKATAIVGPYGQRTALEIDARGFLSKLSNAAGEAYELSYDDGGLLTALIEPGTRRDRHTFQYDEGGRLIRDESPTGFYQTLSREVKPDGVEVTRKDRDQRASKYALMHVSKSQSVRTQTDPAGLTTTTKMSGGTEVRTPTARIVTTTESDPRFGVQASYAATTQIELTGGLTKKVAQTREVELSELANPLSVKTLTTKTSVNDRESVSSYDAATRTVTTTSAAGRKQTVVLDDKGRPARVQRGTQEPVSLAYDARGRLAQTVSADRKASYEYGADGRLSATVDALGRRTELHYDAVGRPVKVTSAGSAELMSSFDDSGALSSITPPGRGKHAFSYGAGSLLQSYQPPALSGMSEQATATSYSYDPYEALSEVQFSSDGKVTYGYEPSTGRLLTETFPSDSVMYGYDAATGQLSSVSGGGGKLSYTYVGPLLASQRYEGAFTASVALTYDANFWPVTRTVGAETVNFGYDADGLLVSAGAEQLARNAQNGWIDASTLGVVSESFTYSGLGEPSAQTSTVSGQALYSRQDTRDALGRVVSRSETVAGESQSITYSYDAQGRLATATRGGGTVSYSYDANGNRTQVQGGGQDAAATYDEQDRLVRYGDASYEWAPSGSLKSKTSPAGTTRYTYDLRGALREATLADGRQLSYVIDGHGRRVGKKVAGKLVQGFLYQSALQPVAELDGSGAVKSTFVYASHVNVPDYLVRGGVAYKLITDVLGSVRLVVNAQTGEVAQRIDYDEFGRVLKDTAPGFQPFGFAGGLYDADTGLVRFGARDYDAEAGRWTARDPIEFSGGQANLYAYNANDPVNFLDPTGMDAWSAAGNFATGVAAGAAGALVVGALAAGAVGLGASAAVVSGVLLTGAVLGTGVVILNSAINISSGNWDAVAFDTGALVGGAGVGGLRGRWLAEAINGRVSPPWSLGSDVAQRFDPSLGPLSGWWATGYNPGSAGATSALCGAGAAAAPGLGNNLEPLWSE